LLRDRESSATKWQLMRRDCVWSLLQKTVEAY
jgi:hypothetical protein